MMRMTPERLVPIAKPLVLLLCLAPLGLLVAGAVADDLGANPVEAITHATGDWALRLLLLTLAMTPLKRLIGRPWPIRFRRLLGLFAFFYAALHLLTYLWLAQGFDGQAIIDDVVNRPYITVGFVACVLLVPLALTSTRGMMRKLGRHWQTLHRAVYAVGILAVLHYLWLVKADLLEPALYALILVLLLAARLPSFSPRPVAPRETDRHRPRPRPTPGPPTLGAGQPAGSRAG